MAVKIRLKRMGKIRAPFYRVVVADSRTKRDGRAIEEIGKYHPTADPSVIDIDSERAQYWLGVGAQPSEQVLALLKITGDWAKFTGEGDPAGTLKVAAPKTSKRDLYEAALSAAEGKEAATPTSRKRGKADDADAAATPEADKKAAAKSAPKAEKKADTKAAADEAPAAEAAADEAPAAEAAADEAPAAEAAADEAPATEVAGLVDLGDGGFGADSAPATEDGAAPEGFDVKGNKDSMKFHVPGSRWYDQTIAEVWFRTAEAAEAAGFEPAGGAAEQTTEDES